MKIVLLFFIYFLISVKLFSQEVKTIFHPVVGDTVSIEEKRLYDIFDEIPYNNFLYGVLSLKKNEYKLIAHFKNDTITTLIDSINIIRYRQNIDKIYALYNSTVNEETDSILQVNYMPNNKNINLNSITPEMRKKISNDAMRYQILNNSADNQGLTGVNKQSYIQTGGAGSIRLKKKKK